MSLTPHGPGFAFLDAFTITEPGRTGVGRKWLDPALAFFADHFPGRPSMPGVLLIECAAQTAGALWGSVRGETTPVPFALAQVMQFRLLRPTSPGATVETTVELEHSLGPLAEFGVVLQVDGTEIARGRLVLAASPAT